MAYKAKPVKDLPTKEEIVEKIRQSVAERETTPTQPSSSYIALKEYMAKQESINEQETVAQTTAAITAPDLGITPFLFGAGGFVLGGVVVLIGCRIKIRHIKAECDAKVSETRATIDRMISVISKE